MVGAVCASCPVFELAELRPRLGPASGMGAGRAYRSQKKIWRHFFPRPYASSLRHFPMDYTNSAPDAKLDEGCARCFLNFEKA